ncbi:MAG: hypothetical protein V2B20_08015, partial [Pseudomonadota bacterium]
MARHNVLLFFSTLLFCFAFFQQSGSAKTEEFPVGNEVSADFLQSLKMASEYKIAVLPMENLTAEGDIAFHFRTRLIERLKAKGFSVIDSTMVDAKLHELGV